MNPLVLEVLVVSLGIALLMVEAFSPKPDKRLLAWIGMAGLATVFVLTFFVGTVPPGSPTAAFYTADSFAIFFKRFALVSTILVLAMSIDYLPVVARFVPSEREGGGLGEFLALPVLTCAGLMWMASAADFISIFVSLELVTISFYVLVAYMRRSNAGLEAGTKYLILGALSTGFVVYGITWIFGMTGQTNLRAISEVVTGGYPAANIPALLFGVGLVIIALGFKVAAFPFQFWVPDVYQGAPTPITAFLSVGSKAAGFVVLLRVLEPFSAVPAIWEKLSAVLAVVAGATLIYGNLAAIPQQNLKRLLSYSSVGHAGYLLMAVASIGAVLPGREAWPAIGFYLAAYLLMTFLAFFVLTVAGGDEISHFNGLARRAPWLAAALLVSMISLAGIPFTAGFLGKLLLFDVALSAGNYVLVGIGVLTVACGFYFYLRVVGAMYWQPVPDGAAPIRVSVTAKVAMALLAVLIFVLGVFPQPVLSLLD